MRLNSSALQGYMTLLDEVLDARARQFSHVLVEPHIEPLPGVCKYRLDFDCCFTEFRLCRR